MQPSNNYYILIGGFIFFLFFITIFSIAFGFRNVSYSEPDEPEAVYVVKEAEPQPQPEGEYADLAKALNFYNRYFLIFAIGFALILLVVNLYRRLRYW
jgi:hypothetical protein